MNDPAFETYKTRSVKCRTRPSTSLAIAIRFLPLTTPPPPCLPRNGDISWRFPPIEDRLPPFKKHGRGNQPNEYLPQHQLFGVPNWNSPGVDLINYEALTAKGWNK